MSLVDTIMAQMEGAKIDLNAPVAIPADTWGIACLIGRTVSLINNGYEDSFDGMDWEDAAREVRQAIREGEAVNTRMDLIKIVLECDYNLEDYR